MGSPLGAVLANISGVTEHKWMMNSPRFHPTLSYRYIDDNLPVCIKFTIEFEQAKEIPFLDILGQRCPNNTFITDIYLPEEDIYWTLYRKTEHFKALSKRDHSSAIADHVKATNWSQHQMGPF